MIVYWSTSEAPMRFVDDTFLIWAHGEEELETFVDHLNKQSDSIKFMKEFEKNIALPFLNTLVIKKQDGGIAHKVYRKKTHTSNTFTPFHSIT